MRVTTIDDEPDPTAPPDPAGSAFDLPGDRRAKAAHALVAADDAFFGRVRDALARSVADLTARLDARRRDPARSGQAALERDDDVRRMSARLRTLRRYGIDLCLGRMVPADGGAPVYVGRLGLAAPDGERLLVDWRTPAAEPFFAATLADPMGLRSRRRYRWTGGRVTDYWDEVLVPEGFDGTVAPDDDSAFVAGLGAARTGRMRDVLATIRADQDAVVRAGARGSLVVDGGPGTGKTVVALHRTAYLLHADPLLSRERGGVLLVGPHRPYLDHVADVLPSLGEDGVRLATLGDLLAEALPDGVAVPPERDPAVARLKGSLGMVEAIEPAVRFSERPPTTPMTVGTPWADVVLEPADWAEVVGAVEPGTPHNDAREQVWETLLDVLVDKHGADDAPADEVRRELARGRALRRALDRAWPLLDATDLVADLWSVPAYLRLCAPWLSSNEVELLQRPDPRAWTSSDLPLLDAARHRLGDPDASRRRRRHAVRAAAERDRMADVVADLIASDDSELQVMSMLRGADLQGALVAHEPVREAGADPFAGPFAHVVVDEAQELTDAEWQVLLRRVPSRSLTVVGDRAQARAGFGESWESRLERLGATDVRVATLTVNYRTPAEVMAEAEPIIRAALPDANVPVSVRSTGVPVRYGSVADLDDVVDGWLAEHPEGVGVVIGADVEERPRVRALDPTLAKGLEFDLVVLVDPDAFGDGVTGAVDRYVAMTRATQRLVVLT